MRGLQLSDNEFFEEYKRLNKLCAEIYGDFNGVSAYIADMESKNVRSYGPSWDADYKMLKHVRWVRNQIAHEAADYQISNSEDLAFVRDYRSRILAGQDALALFEKAKRSAPAYREPSKQQTSAYYDAPRKQSADKWILVAVIIAALALFALFRR